VSLIKSLLQAVDPAIKTLDEAVEDEELTLLYPHNPGISLN